MEGRRARATETYPNSTELNARKTCRAHKKEVSLLKRRVEKKKEM